MILIIFIFYELSKILIIHFIFYTFYCNFFIQVFYQIRFVNHIIINISFKLNEIILIKFFIHIIYFIFYVF